MKIGLFGGAFNPPHREHINIVKELMEERKYDRLVLILSNNPPHKSSVNTPFDTRLELLKLAFSNISGVEISDIEGRDNEKHFSYDIIRYFKGIYEGDELEFIIGGDSMIDFHKWLKPEEIIKLVRIVVVPRGGDIAEVLSAKEHYDGLGADIVVSNYRANAISSSVLRCRIALGDDMSDILEKTCWEFVKRERLYRDYDAVLERLERELKPERFEHTKGVARYAMKLNENLRLDYDRVMLSSLLHDCAKGNVKYSYPIREDAIGTNVEHSFMGRQVAMREYGVRDSEVLDAIEYHCTARPKMSPLEKLIYSADMLEEGREFEGVERLRDMIESDFETGFCECLKATYRHVKDVGFSMYPLTAEAYGYYICGGNN